MHHAFDQDTPAPEETDTPGYSLFDINLGGTVHAGKQLMVFGISVLNMLDTKYVDHLSTLKEVGAYNSGRNFVFSLKIPLFHF